jgi:hypothetical protein
VKTWRHSRWAQEGGLASLEVALIAPALLASLVTVFQVALWFLAAGLVRTAATEGSVDGADSPALAVPEAQAGARAVLGHAGQGIVRAAFVAVTLDAGTVTVTVRGQAPELLPGFPSAVVASAQQPVEVFRPEVTAP